MEDYACLDMVFFFLFFWCVIVSIIVNIFVFFSVFFLLTQKENSLLTNMLTLTVCSSVGLLLFIAQFNELQ